MRHKAVMSAKDFKSSFLSCEKDTELIWRKLLIESKPYSDKLKKLLIVNTKDCLDDSQQQYQYEIDKYSIKKMVDKGYITTVPKLYFSDHEQIKSYIILQFDDFTATSNPQYRDCTVSFTIISNLEYWELDDYKLRPYQIAGYIDGILDGSQLTGIGTLQFVGAKQLVMNEYLGGVILTYLATHEKKEDQNPDFAE